MKPNLDNVARYRPLVDDWEAFLDALRRPLPTCAWANPLRTTPAGLAARLADAGVPTRPIRWYRDGFRLPDGLRPGLRLEYHQGLFHVQEEVSLLPVVALDPQPGERVLDLCAAPGGKTVQIALRLEGRGTVVANDRSFQRMRALRYQTGRLGLGNVTVTTWDATSYPRDAGAFDRVLADVPCSGEGTSRKSPDALEGDVARARAGLYGVQRAILRKAVQLCRPGGRIVYSTCTYGPEENEEVVHDILRDHGDALRVVPLRVPGLVSSEGLISWGDRAYDPSLRGALRVWPHQNDTGGFFVALLEKRSPTGREPVEDVAAEALDAYGPAEDPERWLPDLRDRFGFPAARFEGLEIVRPGRKMLYLVDRAHRTVPRPRPDTVGTPFLRLGSAVPKLTTSAARLLGDTATRNVVSLAAEETARYVQREPLTLPADRLKECTGRGYVLVASDDHVLGTGFLRTDGGDGELQSLYPRGWRSGRVTF
ncbi:MAG: RsmB/NOP family class I SAM-dependent RNA methyltransferase [Myxococcota bacterium]